MDGSRHYDTGRSLGEEYGRRECLDYEENGMTGAAIYPPSGTYRGNYPKFEENLTMPDLRTCREVGIRGRWKPVCAVFFRGGHHQSRQKKWKMLTTGNRHSKKRKSDRTIKLKLSGISRGEKLGEETRWQETVFLEKITPFSTVKHQDKKVNTTTLLADCFAGFDSIKKLF